MPLFKILFLGPSLCLHKPYNMSFMVIGVIQLQRVLYFNIFSTLLRKNDPLVYFLFFTLSTYAIVLLI